MPPCSIDIQRHLLAERRAFKTGILFNNPAARIDELVGNRVIDIALIDCILNRYPLGNANNLKTKQGFRSVIVFGICLIIRSLLPVLLTDRHGNDYLRFTCNTYAVIILVNDSILVRDSYRSYRFTDRVGHRVECQQIGNRLFTIFRIGLYHRIESPIVSRVSSFETQTDRIRSVFVCSSEHIDITDVCSTQFVVTF